MEVVCDKDLIKSVYDYFVKDDRYNLTYDIKRKGFLKIKAQIKLFKIEKNKIIKIIKEHFNNEIIELHNCKSIDEFNNIFNPTLDIIYIYITFLSYPIIEKYLDNNLSKDTINIYYKTTYISFDTNTNYNVIIELLKSKS
tara:strand:- start:1481 stop:1900 length:420 start_codon:yes stop_codon:yes gene_type:complete